MQTYWLGKQRPKRQLDIAVLILLLLAGSFLRMWNLGQSSFWVDEVNTVFAAESVVERGDFALPSGMQYGRAPLYTHSVALTYRLLGVSEATSRLSAALFGVLSILGIYVLGRALLDRWTGLAAAFFLTFSHFAVGWSRVTRMYTLLQLLTLIAAFCFIRGFESKKPSDDSGRSVENKSSLVERWSRVLGISGVSIPWLAGCCIIVAVAIFSVHLLGVFLAAGLVTFIAGMAVITLLFETGSLRWQNKYVLALIVSVVTGAAIWAAMPSLRISVQQFLAYTPPWATGPSSAQRRAYLFDFLISAERFPLAAFFSIGCVQVLTRRSKPGWLALVLLSTPLALLSVVFTHRVPTYLFNVYPFFLLIAAWGAVNLIRSEQIRLPSDTFWSRIRYRNGVAMLFFAVFLVSPWLRITLHIPFQGDGATNMAVGHDEWREASRRVLSAKQEGDLVITSLPQVALYYGLTSDFGLNWNNLEQAREKEWRNADGRYADVYAGIPCILSLEELRSLIASHTSGWLVISRFHLDSPIVTPEDVRTFIHNDLGEPVLTARESVFVYRWGATPKGGA